MAGPNLLRSFLFVPAGSPRKLERAFASNADVVVADLVYAGAQSQKAKARGILFDFVAKRPPRTWAIRVNEADTPEYLDDLAAIVPLAPDYILLPKCEGPRDLVRLSDQLDVLERINGVPEMIKVLPLPTESAIGLTQLDFAGVTPRLSGIVFGAEGLSADLGVEARGADGRMTPLIDDARRKVAVAAAAAQVPAIDTPLPDYRDTDSLRNETRCAADMGFAGKLCIHPAQIDTVHDALAPAASRLAWASAVKQIFDNDSSVGVAVLEGAMVDKAHLKRAEHILRRGGYDRVD